MKRVLLIVFVVAVLIPSVCFCDSIDLSALTLEELSALRDRCQYEMMSRDNWKEVTVPIGVYKIGEDIPAGHWTMRAKKDSVMGFASITYCTALDQTGKSADIMNTAFWYTSTIAFEGSELVDKASDDLDLKEGYIIIEYAPVVFTRYEGKPSFSFD